MCEFNLLKNPEDERIVPFLLEHPRAGIYHHPAWLKAINATFNHTLMYLISEDAEGKLTGLYPFCLLDSILTGKRITAVPFSTYCDPLFPDDCLPSAINYLRKQFPDYKHIELKYLEDCKGDLSSFSKTENYFTHILNLSDSIRTTFNSFHGTSIRASIRRSEKKGLEFKFGKTLDDLNTFYHLEVKLRKRLNYPPLPFNFFYNVWNEFKAYHLIYLPIVLKNGKAVAGGVIFHFKDTFYFEYTASDKKFLSLYPNHKLFWEMIKTAMRTGAKKVDLGRTSVDNKSLLTFKERWNARGIKINHCYFPEQNLVHSNRKLFTNILSKINRVFPGKILELEGKIIYPHLS